MARRNLLAEAQVTAAAEVAPQVAALSEALRQARTDRNSAIRAAAAANAGIAHAIHLAGSSVKKGYSGAQALAAPGQSYSGSSYGAAASNERSVGTTALASSLGNALKELSDRRISAAAGRAYATQRALSDYQGKVAGVQSKRQALAQQQGLLTGSTLSKLTEAQAGRDFTAHESALQRQFTAGENASQRAFTHHEDALGRRSDRITAGIGAQAELGKLASQQKFTAGQNAAARKNARIIAGVGKNAVPKVTQAEAGQRSKIRQLADWYAAIDNGDAAVVPIGKGKTKTIKSMPELKKFAADNGAPNYVILAASNLGTKGYVAPREVQALQNIEGITLPKDWTGVTVRPHTRRRRGK